MDSLFTASLFLSIIFNYIQLSSSVTIDANAILSTNVTLRMQIESDRTYYIAALEIDWDYAPDAVNPFTGIGVNDDDSASTYTLGNDYDRVGSIYRKCLYREFTDATFTTEKTRDADWQHLGILGPTIRGVIDERIKIIFYNNCSYNFSIHPHGVEYNKLSEGAKYIYETGTNANHWDRSAVSGGQYVGFQQTWVYIWDLREEFNYLSSNEFSSKVWFYHSHINEPYDTNAGLVGPILITKKGYQTSSTDPTPKDVDREFVTLFNVFDENTSWYLKYNVENIINSTKYPIINISSFNYDDDDFMESNKMHSMNGYSWNVLSSYLKNKIRLGERIRWYVGAMGTEVDLHTAHWHGNIIINSDDYTIHDVVMLLPSYSTQVDMVTDNPGTWFYHCHVNDHVEAGMIAAYTVENETCKDCYGATHDMFTDTVSEDNNGDSVSIIDRISNKFNSTETWIIVGIACLVNVLCLSLVGCVYYVCKKWCCAKGKKSGPYEGLL